MPLSRDWKTLCPALPLPCGELTFSPGMRNELTLPVVFYVVINSLPHWCMHSYFYLNLIWSLLSPPYPLFFFLFIYFQIDALGKRSKEAEAAFLNVYKRLIDVPGMHTYCLVWAEEWRENSNRLISKMGLSLPVCWLDVWEAFPSTSYSAVALSDGPVEDSQWKFPCSQQQVWTVIVHFAGISLHFDCFWLTLKTVWMWMGYSFGHTNLLRDNRLGKVPKKGTLVRISGQLVPSSMPFHFFYTSIETDRQTEDNKAHAETSWKELDTWSKKIHENHITIRSCALFSDCTPSPNHHRDQDQPIEYWHVGGLITFTRENL